MKKFLFVAIVIALLVATAVQTRARMAQPEQTSELFLPVVSSAYKMDVIPFAAGMEPPINATDIADPGDGRLFVVMKNGRILIADQNGNFAPQPLLDIHTEVDDVGFEKGMLGLAVHPNYAQNGYIYVNYTRTKQSVMKSRVSRFTVTNDFADPASEKILIEVEQPGQVHQAGALHFGPQDGYLYIALGDGGGTLSHANSQDGGTLLGKILRIDVDSGDPYAIPPANPFVDNPDMLDEIWAWGVRNPWRFSFDSATGDMYIADVGGSRWEEINFQPADSPGGENYGWPCFEGPVGWIQPDYCGAAENYVFPVHSYFHEQEPWHCSIIGGYVYHGSEYPDLSGQYLFTDYCANLIWGLYRDAEGNWNSQLWGSFGGNWHTFGERSDGELFLAAAENDTIFKIGALGENGR